VNASSPPADAPMPTIGNEVSGGLCGRPGFGLPATPSLERLTAGEAPGRAEGMAGAFSVLVKELRNEARRQLAGRLFILLTLSRWFPCVRRPWRSQERPQARTRRRRTSRPCGDDLHSGCDVPARCGALAMDRRTVDQSCVHAPCWSEHAKAGEPLSIIAFITWEK